LIFAWNLVCRMRMRFLLPAVQILRLPGGREGGGGEVSNPAFELHPKCEACRMRTSS